MTGEKLYINAIIVHKNKNSFSNMDNDRFHVLIGKSHQMHIKNDWKYVQQKHAHFAIILAFGS
jgi:hypothetical protein